MNTDDEPVACEMFGTPGVGVCCMWTDGGLQRIRWFSGRGFSQRSKEHAHALLQRGVLVEVHAVVCMFKVTEDPAGYVTETIPDDYRPIVDKLMAKQLEGGGLQRSAVSRPKQTHEQMLKESR